MTIQDYFDVTNYSYMTHVNIDGGNWNHRVYALMTDNIWADLRKKEISSVTLAEPNLYKIITVA